MKSSRLYSFIKKITVLTTSLIFLQFHASAEDIKIGMSADLNGTAKELGINMKLGIEACFKEINDAGGINGKKIQLIALNDDYDPAKAEQNMNKLIDEEKVLAVIGNVGTPTAKVTIPIANAKKTLLFGCFTGSSILRKSPPDRYIINVRASYALETKAMIDGLLKYGGVKPEEIAFFTQNDAYGDDGYNGAIAALKEAGYADADKLARGRYERGSVDVLQGFSDIITNAPVDPKAIIIIGTYSPSAIFTIIAKQQYPNLKFLNVSFVGSKALAFVLNELSTKYNVVGASEGVIITQVVPHFDSEIPIVKKYRAALKAFDPKADFEFISLEGYISASIFAEGLKKASSLNRESLIDAIEQIQNLDVGLESPISFSKTEHSASKSVWPTKIISGKFVPIEWSHLNDQAQK